MADQAMTPQVGTVPFTESIEHLRRKLDLPSRWWDDYRGEIHAHAFTVAGATKLDLVADLHAAVTAAIEDGETIGDFRKRFDAIVDQHGWAYRGSRGWRTRMIYDTNLRTAHMAGHWQQMQRTKATRPYLLYLTVDDGNVRDEHQRWHYKLLHIDDVWWDAHLPPNDWGCRCWVVSVSEADIKRLGLKISKSPQVTTSLRINSRTGEVYGEVPDGVGVGWDYNVGKAALVGPTNALGRYIIKAFERGDRFAQAAVGQAAVLGFARQVQAGWQRWVAQVQAEPAEAARYHPAGYLDANVLAALAAADALPSSAAVLAGRSTIAKSTPKKKEGRQARNRRRKPPKAMDPADLLRLPLLLARAPLVYLERATGDLVYVLAGGEDGVPKAIVILDRLQKGEPYNLVRTTGVDNLRTFRDRKRYQLVRGQEQE